MKSAVKLFLPFLVFSVLSSSLFAETLSYLNIVNLVGRSEKLECHLGEEKLTRDGLKKSSATGWFMLPSGEAALNIISLDESGESLRHQARLPLLENASTIFVIYLTKNSEQQAKPKISVASFPAYRSKAFGMKFVSTLPNAMPFKIGSYQFLAKPLDPELIKKWAGESLAIARHGEAIVTTQKRAEASSFYLFLGQWKAETLSVLVRANPQK